MRWYIVSILAILLSIEVIKAEETNSNKLFNFGLVASVNSPFTVSSNLYVDWVECDLPNNESWVGGGVSLFGRFNIKRWYLQVEAGTSIYRNNTTYNTSFFDSTTDEEIDIKSTLLSLNVPVLVGYNIVKKSPYELSIFTGPSLRYIYKNSRDSGVSNGIKLSIDEPVNPSTACYIVGIATKISRFVVDFRYEFDVTVQYKPGEYAVYQDNKITKQGSIYNKSRVNLLSFSLGVIL